MDPLSYLDAVVLGVVEGLTEFLPVSSTGHLTIAEKLLHLKTDDASVTAFTAVVQVGAIAAAIVYFWGDIIRIALGWLRGLTQPEYRGSQDHRMGWYVIVGTLPIAIVGLALRNVIEDDLRSLWWVAGALIAWSAVILFAESRARQTRGEDSLTLRDSLVIGVTQCIALIPGVSRSGATISAGLLLGLDRVAATRLAFFLGIPALTAAGALEAVKHRHDVAWGPTLVGTAVAFVVAYATIAWLLKIVAHHSIGKFVPYRVTVGICLIIVLSAGVMSAT